MALFTLFSTGFLSAFLILTVPPPASVIIAFEHQFSNASHVRWHKEKNNEYEASFKIAGTDYSANFDYSGKWLDTETAIEFDQLPGKVKSAFNASYHAAKIKESAVIEFFNGGTQYEVEFRQGGKTTELIFNPDGTLVKA